MKVVIVTSAFLRFEIEASHWTAERLRNAEGETQFVTRLYSQASGNRPIAEFPDVHAIWDKSTGDLVPGTDLAEAEADA